MNNDTVAVLCPMDCECDLLVSRLAEKREQRVGGYLFYEGKLNGCSVVVARCLIGTVNAAVCALLAIERYAPRCVILQGTSGAHDPALNRNDIVIADRIVSLVHTVSPRRGEGDGTDPFAWEDFGVQTYFRQDDRIDAVNDFSCDEQLVSLARSVPYADGSVTVGTGACGDVWNREADLILHYHRTKNTACEEMEGIGAAQTCAAFGVPMIEIRVISNNELQENAAFSEDTAQSVQRFVCDYLRILRDGFGAASPA